jgi:histidyl-tRNA synthetase
VELILLYDEVFSKLGLSDFDIKINNRKILAGIAEIIGKPDLIIDLTVAIDKIDKIGLDGVEKELIEKGKSFKKEKIWKVVDYLQSEKKITVSREGTISLATR